MLLEVSDLRPRSPQPLCELALSFALRRSVFRAVWFRLSPRLPPTFPVPVGVSASLPPVVVRCWRGSRVASFSSSVPVLH